MKARHRLVVVLSCVVCLFGLFRPAFGSECPITSFGAVGDGKTLNTNAIAKAIGACSGNATADDPGMVVVPAGRFLTAPLVIAADNVYLVFDGPDAVLVASTDFGLWPTVAALPSYPVDSDHTDPRYGAFVTLLNATNTGVLGRGGGFLDGQGAAWWRAHRSLNHTRPCLLEVMWSRNVTLHGIRLSDPPFYTVHIYGSDEVLVDSLTIINEIASPNTDGIDPDSSTHVTIRNCTISTGDDVIAIKSGQGQVGYEYGQPSTDILIENNRFLTGAGIAIGSEMAGGVHNVVVRNNVADAVSNFVRLKGCPHYGGKLLNITYGPNNTLAAGSTAIYVNQNYECTNLNASIPNPVFEVGIETFSGHALTAGSFSCLAGGCVVDMRDVSIASLVGFDLCTNVTGTVSNVHPKPCYGD